VRLIPVTTLNGKSAVTQVTATGTLASGSPVVTGIADTSVLRGALSAAAAGLPGGAFVYSIDSPSQVTLNQPATASGAQSLTFTLEPVALAEAKQHARIEYPDDDALVAGLIRAARRYCETAQKSAILTQTWLMYLDSFPAAGGYYNPTIRQAWTSMQGMPGGLGFYPGMVPNSSGVIDIPLPPLQSITSVQYTDFQGQTQTVDPSLYVVSLGTPARIQPTYSKVWPIARPTIDSVQITFVAGQANTADKVDEDVKAAMKMLIAHWYENREAVGTVGGPLAMAVDALLAVGDPGIYA
jgi:hypothetical protein